MANERSEYREIANLSGDEAIRREVEALRLFWTESYRQYSSVFKSWVSTSPVDPNFPREIRNRVHNLVGLIRPNVGKFIGWEYFVQRGKSPFARWHFDPISLTMVHFGNAASTNIYVGPSPLEGFSPRKSSTISVPSEVLFRLEPTDYHQRGKTVDLSAIRQIVTYYHG